MLKDIQLAKELNKPVVIGEMGFFSDPKKGIEPSYELYESYIRKAYDEWGVDSVMAWGASGLPDGASETWLRPFMDPYYALMRETNGSLDRWNAEH